MNGFRSLLSMLFGAGMLLFIDRVGKQLKGARTGEFFFRRQCWLLIIGFINAYLFLWFWDILYMYAICGMIIYTFRRLPVQKLLIAAAVCLVVTDTFDTIGLYSNKVTIYKGEMLLKQDTVLTKLSAEQQNDLDDYNFFLNKTRIASKQKAAVDELRITKGGFAGLYTLHGQKSMAMQSTGFFTFYLWDILVFMFIGMAFYKQGILTGKASIKFYWILTLSCLSVGLLLSWLRLQPMIDNGFDEYLITKKTSLRFYETARCFRALGVFGLIMLLHKSAKFDRLFRLVQPVGQLALTNYLIQSILCGLFFYGIGFGMFGELGRTELYYIVAVIWLLQVIFSHLWVKYFLYGPFEWAWRSLTYWKKQPFRKENKPGNSTQ
jgi:uncharacterized protein